MDFTKDNEKVALSYQMKESLRDILQYSSEEADLAHAHLVSFARWAKEKGSWQFRKLGKTVEKHLDGIVRAIQTGIDNRFQEGLNGRIQMSKRLARGYHEESRFGRIIFLMDAYRTY